MAFSSQKIRKIVIKKSQVLFGLVIFLLGVVVVLWDRNESLKYELAIAKTTVQRFPDVNTVSANNNGSTGDSQQLKGLVGAIRSEDHLVGRVDAELVLIEFSDYECPYCRSFHSTLEQLVEEYEGRVAWVYRHYPLEFHPLAQEKAEAAECVAEQNRAAFWTYSSALFTRSGVAGKALTMNEVAAVVKELGLDEVRYQECLDSRKYQARIKKDLDEGVQVGIRGTPGTVMIAKDGTQKLIPGALPLTQIKTLIEEFLKK